MDEEELFDQSFWVRIVLKLPELQGDEVGAEFVVLLIANMALFGGMCCFMYWLRYGWPFPPTHEEYLANFQNTLNFAGHVQITLHDLFMQPISLQLVPMQSVVIGLLIASLVSIPILVSILYRLRSSIPFCVMVSVLAVMPWLGVTLLLSCLIAAYSRVKLKFRFASTWPRRRDRES